MSRPTSCSEYGVVFALIFAACTPVPAAVSPAAPASSAASDAAPGASAEAPVTIAAAAPAPDATDRAAAQDPAANGGAQNADVGAPSEAAPGDEEQANGAALAPPADVAAAPADAKRTASGLAYKVLERSKQSNQPLPYDRVTVHYTGWTTDGQMFDSSITRGEPAIFGVNQLIPGFTEGLLLMNVGDKARFWIPEALAYKGRPGPPQGMLVFDVELLSLERKPAPPPAPADVAAPPKNAKRTGSGLAYKILKHGSGKVHPTADDTVTVHYTGWTTDGHMFDSSIVRDQPILLPLSKVIPGWSEGVQHMVEGDTARLWIPEVLAYKGNPGAPQGMLVFDVTLLEIEPRGSDVPVGPDEVDEDY
jgi:FKBP-type peptidyl-prolyl cis-trans isomerase